jgi:2-methylisocitrate lyase-like PEP mutase family enzyme
VPDPPVIADADTGTNEDTVRGRSAASERRRRAHIRTRVAERRVPEGKRVTVEEMVLKVRAAVAARTDPGFVIIGRTDALAVHGWDEAEARARAYHDAGADLVFVDGLKTRADVDEAARRLRGIPQLVSTWHITPEEARDLGFAVYIHLGIMLRHFAAFRASLEELRSTGRVDLSPEAERVEPIVELLQE